MVVVVEEAPASRAALQWAARNFIRGGDSIALLHVCPPARSRRRRRRLRLGGFQLALAFKDLCNGIAEVKQNRKSPNSSNLFFFFFLRSFPPWLIWLVAGEGGDCGSGRGARGDGGGHRGAARRHHARRRPPRQELPLQVEELINQPINQPLNQRKKVLNFVYLFLAWVVASSSIIVLVRAPSQHDRVSSLGCRVLAVRQHATDRSGFLDGAELTQIETIRLQ